MKTHGGWTSRMLSAALLWLAASGIASAQGRVSVDSGEVLWQHSMRTRALSAALTTGGGLVVSADGDRHVSLHDVATGEVVFRTRLPGVAQGYPVTYAVDGKQYLAVPVGGGRVAGSTNTLFVFGVPDASGR